MKFKKKKHKKNKNKEIYKRNLKSQTPEGKSFFKQIPDSPGALAGFMITIMTVYSKVHWGKEIKGKDIFLICQHVNSTVSEICGISTDELDKEMKEVDEWSLKEHREYVEQMMDAPTNMSGMDEDPQVNLENFPFSEEI